MKVQSREKVGRYRVGKREKKERKVQGREKGGRYNAGKKGGKRYEGTE
jgi:hypothetical protein